MINEPLVYFSNEAKFNASKNNSNQDVNIGDASANVVFIGTTDKSKTGKIYTHGQFFGGVSFNPDQPSTNSPSDVQIQAYRWYANDIVPVTPNDTTDIQPIAEDHTDDGKAVMNTRWTSKQPTRPTKKNDEDTTVWYLWMITSIKHTDEQNNVTIDTWSDPVCLGTGKSVGELGAELPEELEQEVQDIRDAITDVENDLRDIHIKSKQDVQDAVDEMFDTWDWFIAKYPQGKAFPYNEESFDNAVGQVVSGLGYVTENGTTYTKIKLFINGDVTLPGTLAELTASVGNIERIIDPNDPTGINYEALGTEVSQKITEDVDGLRNALLDLQAFWGTTNADKELMQYMKSAFSAAANKYTTAATMFSDMEDAAGTAATSAVKTSLGIDENGNIVANGKLANLVENEVESASSGFVTETELQNSFSLMFAKAQSGQQDDPNHTALIAAVRTAIYTNEDGLKTAITSLVATPGTDELKNALAGVFVECSGNGENTLAKIITRNKDGDVGAAITAAVNENKSSLLLTAQDIGITADDLDITAEKLGITALSLHITGDDVLIDPNTTVKGKLTALEGLIANSVDTHSLHTYSNGEEETNWAEITKDSIGTHVVIDDGAIQGYSIQDQNGRRPEVTLDDDGMPIEPFGMYALDNDGSGYIANGNIKWNADGDVIINSKKVNAGSEYNTLEFYKWTIRPIGYDSDYYGYPKYPEVMGTGGALSQSGRFIYELMLGYRIIKNGFVVKDGIYRLTDNIMSPPSALNVTYSGGPYRREGGLEGRIWDSEVGDYVNVYNNYIYYKFYNYKYASITNSSALDFLKSLKQNQNTLFNNIFKDDEGNYIFENGDTIYISFPDNVTLFRPKLLTMHLIDGFSYDVDSNDNFYKFNGWSLIHPIEWANTSSSTSPYLYGILTTMLNDLVDSSTCDWAMNNIFSYNDDPTQVVAAYTGITSVSDSTFASYIENAAALNVNAAELYLIWKNRNILEGAEDYTMWNLYKSNYISALTSHNISKSNLAVLPNSIVMDEIDYSHNRPGYTTYYNYCMGNIGAVDTGNNLSPTFDPLISDAEITVNWSLVIE